MPNTHYFPITSEQRKQMLADIGVRNFRDLLTGVPSEIVSPNLNLPKPLSELEITQLLTQMAGSNGNASSLPVFAGAGAYEHFIPAAVDAITSRGEFVTAYTPYQAEASQGTLEALFEFQTMVCELTGLEVSNASLYDGATSLAEACLVAANATGRKEILIAETVHPEYREVVTTYFKGTGFSIRILSPNPEGLINKEAVQKAWSENIGALVVQSPNFFGLVEDLKGVSSWVHEQGGLLIMTANPMALAYMKSPGEWGADIACGELQPLGIPLSFGGPYAGYFTTTRALMRRVPGRICGETVDTEGACAFTLTLQAREQHIRRERASSNICTNQALCALRATVFLSLMGTSGLRQLAELNMENAYYLREKFAKIAGVSIPYKGTMFNEFVFRTEHPAKDFLRSLKSRGFLGGVSLNRWYPDRKNDVLVCVTETKNKETVDRFVKAVEESL